MRAGRACTHHFHTERTRQFASFVIEIVQDLHVIRHESERRDDHVLHAIAIEPAEIVEDIRA